MVFWYSVPQKVTQAFPYSCTSDFDWGWEWAADSIGLNVQKGVFTHMADASPGMIGTARGCMSIVRSLHVAILGFLTVRYSQVSWTFYLVTSFPKSKYSRRPCRKCRTSFDLTSKVTQCRFAAFIWPKSITVVQPGFKERGLNKDVNTRNCWLKSRFCRPANTED